MRDDLVVIDSHNQIIIEMDLRKDFDKGNIFAKYHRVLRKYLNQIPEL